MEPMSILDQITAGTNDYLVQVSNSRQQLVENLGAMESAATEIAGLRESQASGARVITATQQAAELDAQKYRLKAANAAGIDPSKASDFIVSTMDKLHQAQLDVQTKQVAYEKKRDTKITDGVVDWLIAGFTVDAAKDQVTEQIAEAKLYSDQIATAANVMNQVTSISNQVKESVTAASATAAADLAAKEAQIAALNAKVDAVKYNSLAVSAVKDASKEQLAALYNVQAAKNAEENQAEALRRWNEQDADRDAARSLREATAKAKQLELEEDDYMGQAINAGRASRGLPPLTGSALKVNLKLFRTGGSKELFIDYHNGERTLLSGGPILGASPANALEVIENLPNDIPAGNRRFLAIIANAKEAMLRDPLIAGSKDESAKAAWINKRVAQEIKLLAEQPTSGPDNPFNIGPLQEFFEISSIGSTKIVQEVLKPITDTGVSLDNPKQVIDLGVAAVKKGTLTSNEFAELAHIYQKANLINQQAGNPLKFGITVPNAGRSYKVKLNVFGAPIDITNPTELTRYLSSELSRGAVGLDPNNRSATPNSIRRLMMQNNPTQGQ